MLLVLAQLATGQAVAQVAERVNLAPGGAQAAGGGSIVPALSADGRYLVYVSAATNLVPGDSNGTLDVFLRDRDSGSTTRVSVGSDGTEANGHSFSATISGNGRYVAFWSEATNLAPGDANNAIDVFVRDIQTSQTFRIASGSSPFGHESNLTTFQYSLHAFLSISDDGRYVAYSPALFAVEAAVRVHDRLTGQEVTIGNGIRPSMSGDGRYVAFEGADFAGGIRRAYIAVYDRQTGSTARASVNNSGVDANGDCSWPAMAANGRFIAFECRATNLVASTGDNQNIFVRDLQLGQTSIASVGSGGQPFGSSLAPAISADGRFIVFAAGRLVNLPQYLAVEIYVRDRQTGEARRLTQHLIFNAVHASSFSAAISADGQWIAFASSDSDLVGGDTNAQDDVFLVQNTSCQYALSAAAQAFSAGGGGGSIAITAGTGCDWTATSQVAWITLTGAIQGSGNGTVSFSVAAHTASSIRTGTVTVAGQFFTVTQSSGPVPTVTLTPSTVNFGVVNAAGTFTFATPTQTLTITQAGAGAMTWAVTKTQPWITVTPMFGSGPGLLSVSINNAGGVLPPSGSLSGTITLVTSGAANSPSATVNLTVFTPGTSTPASGIIDTPTPGQSGITGSLPVTGWAVDDIGASQVRILRAPVAGEAPGVEVFIGNAIFVNGARPDLAATFPTKPLKDQAGWGFLVLTNFLPNQGNGTFTLYVYADDIDGHTTLLGTRTITCTNATATVPFGAIDTPAQGGTVSGSTYVNFGWALAAQPAASGRFIPVDGSTVQVYVDSVLQGTATYNNPRSDIQALFPGYANTDGAVGFKVLDTTALANGVHTIFWIVTDNTGAAAGIGSRYFTVSNSSLDASVFTVGGVTADRSAPSVGVTAGGEAPAPAGGTATVAYGQVAVTVRSGFTADAPASIVTPDLDGVRRVRTVQLDRIAVDLSLNATATTRYRGYALSEQALTVLPIGSHLDQRTGEFGWAPGLAFGGTHRLLFVRHTDGHSEQMRVDVTVDPQPVASDRCSTVETMTFPGSTPVPDAQGRCDINAHSEKVIPGGQNN